VVRSLPSARPDQLLAGEPAQALHEAALDLAAVDDLGTSDSPTSCRMSTRLQVVLAGEPQTSTSLTAAPKAK
jgi:hypothetical protein